MGLVSKPKTQRQCAKCPWKKSTDPRDIPNGYCETKHRNLKSTIARPGDLSSVFSGTLRAMACHDSMPGKEIPCVGWVANQIGPGNNIALRLRVMSGSIRVPETVGEQHETFEDTLPRRKKA